MSVIETGAVDILRDVAIAVADHLRVFLVDAASDAVSDMILLLLP